MSFFFCCNIAECIFIIIYGALHTRSLKCPKYLFLSHLSTNSLATILISS